MEMYATFTGRDCIILNIDTTGNTGKRVLLSKIRLFKRWIDVEKWRETI